MNTVLCCENSCHWEFWDFAQDERDVYFAVAGAPVDSKAFGRMGAEDQAERHHPRFKMIHLYQAVLNPKWTTPMTTRNFDQFRKDNPFIGFYKEFLNSWVWFVLKQLPIKNTRFLQQITWATISMWFVESNTFSAFVHGTIFEYWQDLARHSTLKQISCGNAFVFKAEQNAISELVQKQPNTNTSPRPVLCQVSRQDVSNCS